MAASLSAPERFSSRRCHGRGRTALDVQPSSRPRLIGGRKQGQGAPGHLLRPEVGERSSLIGRVAGSRAAARVTACLKVALPRPRNKSWTTRRAGGARVASSLRATCRSAAGYRPDRYTAEAIPEPALASRQWWDGASSAWSLSCRVRCRRIFTVHDFEAPKDASGGRLRPKGRGTPAAHLGQGVRDILSGRSC